MIKLGMVGTGLIGQWHSKAILKNPECELVAVADIAIEKTKDIADSHNAKAFSDYKQMCEDVELDGVILNLPHYLHRDATIYFLDKGVNVLVEKPMAMNTAECDEMIIAAKNNNVKLAVGHVQRYYNAYRRIKEIIENGEMGKLCMITEVRNTDYVPGRPEWFLKKDMAGGGIIMNYGVHTLDKIMYTTGLSVKDMHFVKSNPLTDDDVELNAHIFFELTDGVTATVTYCGCQVPEEYETSFYFTNGAVKVADGYALQIAKDGKYVNAYVENDIFEDQINEFIKLLKGEESEIATPEYGREIISVVEKMV